MQVCAEEMESLSKVDRTRQRIREDSEDGDIQNEKNLARASHLRR